MNVTQLSSNREENEMFKIKYDNDKTVCVNLDLCESVTWDEREEVIIFNTASSTFAFTPRESCIYPNSHGVTNEEYISIVNRLFIEKSDEHIYAR